MNVELLSARPLNDLVSTGICMYNVNYDCCEFTHRQAISIAGALKHGADDFFDLFRQLNLGKGRNLNLPALITMAIFGECAKLGISIRRAFPHAAGLINSALIECGTSPQSWKGIGDDDTTVSFNERIKMCDLEEARSLAANILNLENRIVRQFLFCKDGGDIGATIAAKDIFISNDSSGVRVIDARAIARTIMSKHKCGFFEITAVRQSAAVQRR
jgi:hypothetical protein